NRVQAVLCIELPKRRARRTLTHPVPSSTQQRFDMRDPALDPTIDPHNLTDDEWRLLLDPVEYNILRHAGTERAGTGRYLDEERDGAFHCAGCGQRLYAADHKFHSGCGWPSFFQEVDDGAIVTHRDTSHGMVRTEMRCS